jgi:hypothetical protein
MECVCQNVYFVVVPIRLARLVQKAQQVVM